jgi:hypothetical protein
MVMMAKRGQDLGPHYYQDATMVDFRDVVEYLQLYRDGDGSATADVGSMGHFGNMIISSKGGKVGGVRVNYHHDQYERNGQALEDVKVPRRHPIFYKKEMILCHCLNGSSSRDMASTHRAIRTRIARLKEDIARIAPLSGQHSEARRVATS